MSDYTPLEKDVSPSSAIDGTGLRSPVPLLRLKKELAVLKAGEIVQLDSDDPNTGSDVASWCSKGNKYTYLGEKKEGSIISYFVQKN